ncbi:MAG: B12-binding domain-containing radical SAM protein [Thermoanaerobaculia bacterium]
MILLVNPRATRPKNRRFPLSLMALGAVLPEGVSWRILDGNLPDADLLVESSEEIERRRGTADPVTLVAMTVMPGPQLVSAVPLARALKERFPFLPIAWGGYFPTLYPGPCLSASYVDWIVRGQGERTFLELLGVLDGEKPPASVAGLGWKDGPAPNINPERRWEGPDALPDPPYDRIEVPAYLHPTNLGRRSAVHQTSIGCPYTCNFCGVIAAFGSLERFASPERTERALARLAREHGADSVHFYDNNFFLKEDHAREIAGRLAPLGLRFWCEARIDVMLRFSDVTWEAIRRAGFRMIYFGAESGSDDVLRKMSKNLTTEETLALAAKARAYGIAPEFSFMFGDPDDPAGEAERTLAFVERLRLVNPAMKLISYFYTPTPQRRGTYGGIDALAGTPGTLEEWIAPEWVGWMTHESPCVPWLTPELRARVATFTASFGGVGPEGAEAYGHLREVP